MKRLDELEKNMEFQSGGFLLYAVAIALILFYLNSKEWLYLALGLVCYFAGALISIKYRMVSGKKRK